MSGRKKTAGPGTAIQVADEFAAVCSDITALVQASRQAAARSVNAFMTATYWEIGRRIVEAEQGGERRAAYGEQLITRLAEDLTGRFGRGFSRQNLQQMRAFYDLWPLQKIRQTVSGELTEGKGQTPSGEFTSRAALPDLAPFAGTDLVAVAARFPLPWSAYVRLLSVRDRAARAFYEAEALRAGWSVRQLDRQISSQFYERTALSRNKAAMLAKAAPPLPGETPMAEEAIKDPFVLEFLGLRDEYAESDLEKALVQRMEDFLLELGDDFCFVGRQRRLRIGDEWYRVDLLFFNRRLRALVVIDLKIGKFSHADAGQMHMYLNYARENWMRDGENPPVGLILCAQKDAAVARYALEGLPNKVLAAEYTTVLPDAERIATELARARQELEFHSSEGKEP